MGEIIDKIMQKKKKEEPKPKITNITLEDLMALEAPRIKEVKQTQKAFADSGHQEIFKDFSDQIKVTDFSQWQHDFQDKTFQEFSEQLKADGIAYSLYDEYKDLFNKLKRETDVINENIGSKQLTVYIKERERLYNKYRNPNSYLDRLDAIIAQGSLDKTLLELDIPKTYWDSELKRDPDNLLIFMDSKADAAEKDALSRMNNNLTPTRLQLQDYQKYYKINTDKFNSDIALAFQRMRDLTDEDTPEEMRNVLNCEDKMLNTVAEMNNIIAKNKHRFYATTYIYRTMGKEVQRLQDERKKEEAKTEAEKKKTKTQEAKTAKAEAEEQEVKDRIAALEKEETDTRTRIDNLIALGKTLNIPSNGEQKKDNIGGEAKSDVSNLDADSDKASKIDKRTLSRKEIKPTDALITKMQAKGYIHLPDRNIFVAIKLQKGRPKDKPRHTVLNGLGLAQGSMDDLQFKRESAKLKVKQDDAKRINIR